MNKKNSRERRHPNLLPSNVANKDSGPCASRSVSLGSISRGPVSIVVQLDRELKKKTWQAQKQI